jgi:hypothetical protein
VNFMRSVLLASSILFRSKMVVVVLLRGLIFLTVGGVVMCFVDLFRAICALAERSERLLLLFCVGRICFLKSDL